MTRWYGLCTIKDGSGSDEGQYQKKKIFFFGICMNGLTKHIQNLRQFTRWDSNPREYEALIYTNIQLICSDTCNVTRVAALETCVIFTHKLYRWFHKMKLKIVSHKMRNFQSILQFLFYCRHHHRCPICLYCLNILHNDYASVKLERKTWHLIIQAVQLKSGPYFNMSNLFAKILQHVILHN
jgi:hypothetical protein